MKSFHRKQEGLPRRSPSTLLGTQAGQSLLEVLVALAVALLVILALVQAVTTAIKSNNFAKKKVQAASLAQEGIEKVRGLRDQSSWANFKLSCNNYNAGTVNDPTIFTRTISCSEEAPDKIKVVVKVSWTDSGKTQNSQIISYFTQWP